MSADLLLGLPAKVKLILDRLTQSRADSMDNLSNLDVTVSSRAPSSDTSTLLSRLTDLRAGYLDLIPGLGASLKPPAGVMALAEWPAGGSVNTNGQLNQLALRSADEVDGPSGLVEVLNLSGPGIISFLAVQAYENSTDDNWTFELEVDGIVVSPPSYGVSNMPAYGVLSMIGAATIDPSNFNVVGSAFQPVPYLTSVILRATNNYTSNRTLHTFIRNMPTG
jgi:hypothetical protein